MIQRRLHTMTAGDIESVFSGHPRRRLRPHTVGGAWTDVDQILLCTDGFARVVSCIRNAPANWTSLPG